VGGAGGGRVGGGGGGGGGEEEEEVVAGQLSVLVNRLLLSSFSLFRPGRWQCRLY